MLIVLAIQNELWDRQCVRRGDELHVRVEYRHVGRKRAEVASPTSERRGFEGPRAKGIDGYP
jgi:hypothetical protein